MRGMDDVNLPIACSLAPPEFQERRSTLLRKVKEAVVEVRELSDGYAYRFPSDVKWIVELTNMIVLERQCCPFLSFHLRVEPADGPIWLELSGPQGTRDFLNSLFS